MIKDFIFLLLAFALLSNMSVLSCGRKSPSSVVKSGPKTQYSSPLIDTDTLLSSNAPTRITRNIRLTQNNNLLMASFEDIIIYDGVNFSPIPKPKGFESFDAYDALEDRTGAIWIASTHFGVFRYNSDHFDHYTTEDGLGSMRTMHLFEDSKGNIWVGTMGGLSLFRENGFENFKSERDSSSNDISTIMEDQSGNLWLGTRGRTFNFNPITKTYNEFKGENGHLLYNIWSIKEDIKGNIWFGGQNGLWRYSKTSFTKIKNEFVNSLHFDGKGNLWAITPRSGLFRFDHSFLEDDEISPELIYINSGMVFHVSGDKSENIWLGAGNGVLKYSGESMIRYERIE